MSHKKRFTGWIEEYCNIVDMKFFLDRGGKDNGKVDRSIRLLKMFDMLQR